MNHLESETSKVAESGPASEKEVETGLKEAVVAALKTVYDPEIPVDIYELGLVYELEIEAPGAVSIQMTLTSPACPVAGTLPGEVEASSCRRRRYRCRGGSGVGPSLGNGENVGSGPPSIGSRSLASSLHARAGILNFVSNIFLVKSPTWGGKLDKLSEWL